MMNQLSPILEFLLSALPAALIVVLLGLYLAGLYWREDSKRKLNEYLKNLRNHDVSIQKYNSLLGKFNEFENKPPFDTQFDTILKKLAELHNNRDREMKLYTRLRGEMDQHSQKGLLNRILAPWHWLETHQKLGSLDHLDMIVATNVDAVGIDVDQLTHIQNEISRQITTAWQEIQELEQNIQNLLQRGMRADAITPYKHTYSKLRQRFSAIPAYLLTPSPATPANDDTLKHIAAAYSILEESRPELDLPLTNTRLWLDQTELLPQAIEQVVQKTSELKENVLLTPENIDVTAFYDQLKESQLAIEHAKEFSEQIDPFHLDSILEAMAQQYEKLNAAIAEIKTAESVLQEYQQYRDSLANQWYAIETLRPRLEENPVLPIVLTETSEELEFLSASLKRLLNMRDTHTLDSFRQEMPILQEKIRKAHTLQTDLLTLQTTQAELMTLVKRLQQPRLNTWIQKTKDAQSRLNDYARGNYILPPNWAELDLDTEIVEIEEQARESLPALNQPVREENLLEMWQVAQNIDKMVTIIQDGINNQLQQRKALIEQEREILEDHTVVFEQMNRLKDVALEKEQLLTTRQYFQQLDQIKKELADRTQRTVAQKEKVFRNLEAEISAQVDEWRQDAQTELRDQNQSLAALLEEVKLQCNLSDDILQETAGYLNEEAFYEQPETPSLEGAMELFLRAKTQQEQTQQLLNGLAPLHAEVLQQFEAYHQVQDKFNTAMTAAGEFVDFSSSWNQNIVNLERVQKQGHQFTQEMNNFVKTEHHSQSLIRKLKQYISRYDEQYERMTELVAQIQEEQAQQKEAEDALQVVVDQWEQVARIWRDDAVVAENVDNLIKRYQNRYRDAKTNYERGKIRFSAFISTINSLKKHLSFEAITNANEHSVEISGKEYI